MRKRVQNPFGAAHLYGVFGIYLGLNPTLCYGLRDVIRGQRVDGTGMHEHANKGS